MPPGDAGSHRLLARCSQPLFAGALLTGAAAPRTAFSSRKGKQVCTSPRLSSYSDRAATVLQCSAAVSCYVGYLQKQPRRSWPLADVWSGKDGSRRVWTSLPLHRALCSRSLATSSESHLLKSQRKPTLTISAQCGSSQPLEKVSSGYWAQEAAT